MEPSTQENKDISWLIVLAAFAAALLHLYVIQGIPNGPGLSPDNNSLSGLFLYTLIPWIWATIIIGLIKLVRTLFKASYVKPKRDAIILALILNALSIYGWLLVVQLMMFFDSV